MEDIMLLLRYSDFHGVKTIKEHESVIKRNGKCWWAKLGKQPSEAYLKLINEQPNKKVLLYTPKILHICELGEITFSRPKEDYPEYYERDIFNQENESGAKSKIKM